MTGWSFARYLKFYQDCYNQAKARLHMAGKEYGELTVLVDGAVNEEYTVNGSEGGTEMGKIIARVMVQAEQDKKPTQVFLLWHEHPPLAEGEECACAQHEQNHQPMAQWNMQPEGEG